MSGVVADAAIPGTSNGDFGFVRFDRSENTL